MKEKASSKKHTPTNAPKVDPLYAQVTASEKKVEKAWADYEEKEAAYQKSLKHHTDKMVLHGLLAAAKIARFTYKIKKVEHKLAKSQWKSALKSDKMPGQAANKDTVKIKSKKNNHKAPKDIAAKGKSSSESSKPKVAQKGKKKSAAQG